MCKCKRCGQPVEDCQFTLCIKCFLETSDDRVKKNIVAGGRFYERRTMREKIAELITRTHRTDSSWLYMGDAVDQILTLITEEIEKGLLTDIDGKDTVRAEADLMAHNFKPLFSYRQAYFIGCQSQLDKILSLLRPKENPVGNAEL